VAAAVETFGPWHAEGLAFVRELRRRTTQVTGDPRETTYLLQRFSAAVQLGNVTSFAGSMPIKESVGILDDD